MGSPHLITSSLSLTHTCSLLAEYFQSQLLSFSPNLDYHNPDIPEWRQDIASVIKRALVKVSRLYLCLTLHDKEPDGVALEAFSWILTTILQLTKDYCSVKRERRIEEMKDGKERWRDSEERDKDRESIPCLKMGN